MNGITGQGVTGQPQNEQNLKAFFKGVVRWSGSPLKDKSLLTVTPYKEYNKEPSIYISKCSNTDYPTNTQLTTHTHTYTHTKYLESDGSQTQIWVNRVFNFLLLHVGISTIEVD